MKLKSETTDDDVRGVVGIDSPFTFTIVNHAGPVVVDMSKVSHIASVGIKGILVGSKRLNAQGRRMVRAQPTATVKAVLATISMDRLPTTDSIGAGL